MQKIYQQPKLVIKKLDEDVITASDGLIKDEEWDFFE